MEEVTANALWGAPGPFEGARLGRPDVAGSPTLRLLASDRSGPAGRWDLRRPGPVGIGVTTGEIERVHARLAACGVEFLSPPVQLLPEPEGPSGPRRYEAFGRQEDGAFLVLIERLNAPTPYGSISSDARVSEPLHCSHVVVDLAAASRFMVEVLEHEPLFHERCEGPTFERLMGLPPGARFEFEMLHHPGFATGRIIFIAHEGRAGEQRLALPPMRGVSAHRYDCDDLEATLARVEPSGGEIVAAPAEISDPLLGRGRAAAVMPPFGTLVELWERR